MIFRKLDSDRYKPFALSIQNPVHLQLRSWPDIFAVVATLVLSWLDTTQGEDSECFKAFIVSLWVITCELSPPSWQRWLYPSTYGEHLASCAGRCTTYSNSTLSLPTISTFQTLRVYSGLCWPHLDHIVSIIKIGAWIHCGYRILIRQSSSSEVGEHLCLLAFSVSMMIQISMF